MSSAPTPPGLDETPKASAPSNGSLAQCANHHIYGCDPDGTAERRDIYRGDEIIWYGHSYCLRCRSAMAFEGLDVIVPENDESSHAGAGQK